MLAGGNPGHPSSGWLCVLTEGHLGHFYFFVFPWMLCWTSCVCFCLPGWIPSDGRIRGYIKPSFLWRLPICFPKSCTDHILINSQCNISSNQNIFKKWNKNCNNECQTFWPFPTWKANWQSLNWFWFVFLSIWMIFSIFSYVYPSFLSFSIKSTSYFYFSSSLEKGNVTFLWTCNCSLQMKKVSSCGYMFK